MYSSQLSLVQAAVALQLPRFDSFVEMQAVQANKRVVLGETPPLYSI